jgi:hypothetical protein
MKRVKRAAFRLWLHTADALVTRLDRLLSTPPASGLWVPESRPDPTTPWEEE